MTSRRRDAIRVQVVGPHLELTPGGMASITKGLLESRILREEGFEVRFLASHREGTGVNKLRAALEAAIRIALGRNRPDLIHLQIASGASVKRKAVIMVAARLRGIRTLAQLHAADAVDDFSDGSRLHRLAYKIIFNTADAVCVLGSPTHSWATGNFPHANVAVLPNFVSLPSTITPPSAPTSLLFLGRLSERKGIWDLLRALELVWSRSPDALSSAVLAGDGEVQAVRDYVARSSSLHGRVEVPGWLSLEARIAALDNCSILALPSYAEGLPMSILEAMARGRPVITTDVGAVVDAVEHGVTGVIVRPGDIDGLACALSDLACDPQLLSDMGKHAREKAASLFSEAIVAHKLASMYRDLYGKH